MTGQDEEQDYEEYTIFIDCTCEHEPSQHGWISCEVVGCPCEGAWEE